MFKFLLILIFLEEDLLEGKETLGAFEVVEDVLFADQSYSIQKRLEKLDEKILNKTQAIQTLKNSTKIDVKVSSLRSSHFEISVFQWEL